MIKIHGFNNIIYPLKWLAADKLGMQESISCGNKRFGTGM
jgi:hypothetical protein